MVFAWNWGIAGLVIPVPAVRDGIGPSQIVPSWSRLKFSPIGVFDLCRRLGVHASEGGVFQRYRDRFLTSDIAWFAGGASTDGLHAPTQPGFFPDFDALRQTLPSGAAGNEARRALDDRMQHAVFDLATLWDRTFGGTTMVLHVAGTTIPNTPAQPEYLRASAYLPPTFIAANPASHAPIAQIAQMFIEAVGVPTVEQWRANALLRGWALTQQGLGALPNTPSPVLIHNPRTNTAHYKFYGRPVGTLDPLLAAATTGSFPVVIIADDDEEEEYDQTTIDLMDATEHAAYAESEIQALEEQIRMLVDRLNTTEALCTDLQSQLTRRTLETPSTPSRSRTHTTAVRTATPSPLSSSPHMPPPYSPSARSHIPSSSRSQLAEATTHEDDQPSLDAFLCMHRIEYLAGSIDLVIRAFPQVKWHEEFLGLDIPASLIPRLLDIVAPH
ncbi:hypothetical protein K438DRAFT_1966103 [Mycena galopus ATCC 62051]|nr:hypothetical protein K438DRAFT_1966103 [Mycena galopus ATCC 62051]